LSMDPR